jgi:hypothetical protein
MFQNIFYNKVKKVKKKSMGLCLGPCLGRKKTVTIMNPLVDLQSNDVCRLKNLNPLITCPITQDEFIDPVVASDGHTYDREGIESWFKICNKAVSPITGERLSSTTLYSNFSIRYIQRVLQEKQSSK